MDTNKYETKLDSKKRITIRSPRTQYYAVTEQVDGTIILSPRELIHPDEISKRTLEMMDQAIGNLKKGKGAKPVDLDELNDLLEN